MVIEVDMQQLKCLKHCRNKFRTLRNWLCKQIMTKTAGMLATNRGMEVENKLNQLSGGESDSYSDGRKPDQERHVQRNERPQRWEDRIQDRRRAKGYKTYNLSEQDNGSIRLVTDKAKILLDLC
ncbi:hypothetical protein TEA_019092 [Camellia sinensis var. sinensis]|uniref:Uncharacterized protein n=1 Tax=Camellia sinensis var. sinensis TaxID=542762 RepID=A0A4S4DZK1_CAMSN|nr:hypothetical protein TEA_019092 [Camellia sinensis var. sinensis]